MIFRESKSIPAPMVSLAWGGRLPIASVELMRLRTICHLVVVVAASLFVGCDNHTRESGRSNSHSENASASKANVEPHGGSEDSERIPKTLDEALDLMMAGLTEEDRDYIEKAGDDYAGMVHFGQGMGMRNSWGLWGDSPLKRYFVRLGIYHADDMSAIISQAFSRRVRGRPIELDQLVRYYRDYWEKEDIVAPLDLNCPHCHKELVIGYLGSGHSKDHPDRVYFSGTCPDGFQFNYYHRDGWVEGWPEYSEQARAEYLTEMATSHEETGDYAAALTDYEKALKLDPGSETVLNGLAWFLATTPAPLLRDGKRSLSLAQDAVRVAGQPGPEVLDTLAAGYAATGDFESAVTTLEQAISIADNDPLRSELSERLGLYKESKPFVSPASASKIEQPANDRFPEAGQPSR